MINYSEYLNEDYDDYYISDDPYRQSSPPLPIIDIGLDRTGCQTQGRSEYIITMFNYTRDYDAEYILTDVLHRSSDLCRKQISESWFDFNMVLDRTDMVFILSKLIDVYDEDSEVIIGFALCANKASRTAGEDNSLYIDTICTEPQSGNSFPAGKALLNSIYNYAIKENYSYLSLRALAHVVNYYRKFGFRFLKPGQTKEEDLVGELSDLNQQRVFNTGADANRNAILERALQLSQEVDEEGIPTTSLQLFAEIVKEDMALSELPTEQEVEQMIASLPSHVKQTNGHNGIYDLYFTLIKKGFANLKDCPGITKRQFTRPEVVKPGILKRWITCEDGGFIMNKPLFITPQTIDIARPIIDCQPTRGGSKRKPKQKAVTIKKKLAKQSRKRRLKRRMSRRK